MKRKIVVALIGLIFMLSACGNDMKVIEGEVATTVIENKTQDKQQTEPKTKAEITVQEETSESTYKGYAFVYNDVVIEIDAEATPIIEELGAANSYFEAPSCAFEGIDKMYTYTSFEVDTYPLEGQDYISAIIFKDDAILTAEGICIGDSIDKVKEIYGDDSDMDNGMLVYKKDDMKLCFIIQNEAVVSIEYRTTVLEE